MTLRTDRTGDDTEPPGLTPDVADDLADMLRRGRTVGGEAVTRVVFRLADGRRVSAELPAPRAELDHESRGDDEKDAPLSSIEQGIVDVLRRNTGRRMQANEIAPLIDEDEDPYGGTFKRAISRLKLLEMIEGGKREGGYRLKSSQK